MCSSSLVEIGTEHCLKGYRELSLQILSTIDLLFFCSTFDGLGSIFESNAGEWEN